MQTTPPLPRFFARHFNLIVASLMLAIMLGLCAFIGWTTPAALAVMFLTGWLVVPGAIIAAAIDRPEFWQPSHARLAIGLVTLLAGLVLLPRLLRRIRGLRSAQARLDGHPGNQPRHRLLTAGMAVSLTGFLVSLLMAMITLSQLLTPPPPTPRPTWPRSDVRTLNHLRGLAIEARLMAWTEDRLPATMEEFINAIDPFPDRFTPHRARHPADPPAPVIYIGGLDTRLHRDVPVAVFPPPAPGATWLAATMADDRHLMLTDAEWRRMVPEWKAMLEGSDCRWPAMLDPEAHGLGMSWTRIDRDGIEH